MHANCQAADTQPLRQWVRCSLGTYDTEEAALAFTKDAIQRAANGGRRRLG